LVFRSAATVLRVPPTICFTCPECRSMHGLNLVIFELKRKRDVIFSDAVGLEGLIILIARDMRSARKTSWAARMF
jgi:hypothetical protein